MVELRRHRSVSLISSSSFSVICMHLVRYDYNCFFTGMFAPISDSQCIDPSMLYAHCLCSYGLDIGTNLPELLYGILDAIPEVGSSMCLPHVACIFNINLPY